MKTVAAILMAILPAPAAMACATAQPGAPLLLRRSATVRGEIVYLADLLPPGAPEPWREAARAVEIAAAPQPGLTRTLNEREISAAMEKLGDCSEQLAASIDTSEPITLRREARFVTAAEVARLLHFSSAASAAGEILVPRIPVPVDAELRLSAATYDAATRRTYFQLQATGLRSGAPHATVLVASVAGDARAAVRQVAPGPLAKQPPATGMSVPANHEKAPRPAIAARRGQRALALLELPGLRITRMVLPLRDGALGETIPVREPNSRASRSALVIGEARVRLLSAAGGRQEIR